MHRLKCDLTGNFPDQYCGEFTRTKYELKVSNVFPTDAQEAATGDPMANLSGEADDDRAVARWRG